MNRHEAKSARPAILSFARANDKPRLQKLLDAYIDGKDIQVKTGDGSWTTLVSPSFSADHIAKMRIKPGMKPYNASEIHRVNGKKLVHNITGEARFFFVDTKHKASAYKKDKDVTAAELLRDWMFEDGTKPGVMEKDPEQEALNQKKQASIEAAEKLVSNVQTNVAGIKGVTKELTPSAVLEGLRG